MNVLVLLEATYLFFIRAERGRDLAVLQSLKGNRPVWIAVGLVVLAQLLLCGLAPLQAVFGTELPRLSDLGLMALAAIGFWLVLWLERVLRTGLARRLGWRIEA